MPVISLQNFFSWAAQVSILALLGAVLPVVFRIDHPRSHLAYCYALLVTCIVIVIPSLTDPSVAPPGKHVLSCFVQYAPYNLKEGDWDDKREEFGDTVIDTIAEHAPNIKDLILHRQVLTPLDLERDFGLSEGNIFQGELTLEQLFFLRPAPGWAQYRTPIRNLYMCGSATHPGGGIMGANGRPASQVILKEWSLASLARRAKSGPSRSTAAASKAAN